ncbi:Integrin beta-7 isoform X1 [Oopsacas minuta]|uniref:Integrin beta-7 isoform X1 n=1 Tax=Oopsacas minuta TaxID=111878 RepID=A0AAV7JMM8_9METZ|nr:Integrin beta-7 isoform X1 [Oopsacas minuta]
MLMSPVPSEDIEEIKFFQPAPRKRHHLENDELESTKRAILEKEDKKLEILTNNDSKLDRLESKFDRVIQILQHTAADQSKTLSLLMAQTMPPLPHFQTLPPSFPTYNFSSLPHYFQSPIENLYIGLLAEDSRNVVELIENAYRSIAETIQVRNGTTNSLRIIANATCLKQTEDGQCTGVTIGTEATYDITVELLDCASIDDQQSLRFVFYGDIIIEIEQICECDCSTQADMNNEFCNNEILLCGQCICGDRQGSRCECPSSQNTFENNELCRRSNSSDVVCSIYRDSFRMYLICFCLFIFLN